jgi:1,4-dihydroxy-2-naphthoate octaprenyltransferase/chlorophyll synthase
MPYSKKTFMQRWLYAIKPASWPKLLVPMTLGQVLGIVAAGAIDLLAIGFGVLFTICLGTFIVLINDWGDQKVDRIKRELFPDDCSAKTIIDGIFTARKVLLAGVGAGVAALMLGWLGQIFWERELLLLATGACLLTFVAYTLPPLRLNYRGGGEFLEMAGVGLLLPWWNAYVQSGETWSGPWALLAGFTGFSLASALASGLSDEVSDRLGGKRTFTTLAGNQAVRRVIEGVMLGAVALWAIVPCIIDTVPWWTVAPAIVVVLTYWRAVTRISYLATTNAFAPQKRYKLYLHKAIWYGGLVLSAALLSSVWIA